MFVPEGPLRQANRLEERQVREPPDLEGGALCLTPHVGGGAHGSVYRGNRCDAVGPELGVHRVCGGGGPHETAVGRQFDQAARLLISLPLRLEGGEDVPTGQAFEGVRVRVLAQLTEGARYLRGEGVRQVDQEAGTGPKGVHEQRVPLGHHVLRVMGRSPQADRYTGHDFPISL